MATVYRLVHMIAVIADGLIITNTYRLMCSPAYRLGALGIMRVVLCMSSGWALRHICDCTVAIANRIYT